jgi:heat shock protein 1/8
VADVKRLIGRTYTNSQVLNRSMRLLWPFRVARGLNDKPMIHVEYKGKEKVFSPEEVYAMVLGKMKDLAEVYLGSVVNGWTCMSVPHCFNFMQRQAVRNACSMAGFETYTVISDHSCAALAYIVSGMNKGREFIGENSIMFFDLGGGTLDVTLIVIEEGIIEVKATRGDSHLGGEDFDLKLLNHFIEKIKLKYEKDVTDHPRAVMRLKKQVERVKLALSSGMEATIQIDSLLEGFDFEFSITRSCFEEMNVELFRKCIYCVEKCLQDAKMSKKDVQEVVLIGGSSRIPKVQQLLVDFFENQAILNKSINPDEAVVCGAVVQNGIYGGAVERWGNFLLLDVTPHSYGLETNGGVMTVMVSRNTTIPIKKEQLFSTSLDNQLGMLFKVYEGERARVRDNNLIAIFELPGIPPAPRGVPRIRVTFDIDAQEKLNVSAKDEHSGQKWEIFSGQKEEIFEVKFLKP